MFNGKIHYKWPFSIATLNYQRVVSGVSFFSAASGMQWGDLFTSCWVTWSTKVMSVSMGLWLTSRTCFGKSSAKDLSSHQVVMDYTKVQQKIFCCFDRAIGKCQPAPSSKIMATLGFQWNFTKLGDQLVLPRNPTRCGDNLTINNLNFGTWIVERHPGWTVSGPGKWSKSLTRPFLDDFWSTPDMFGCIDIHSFLWSKLKPVQWRIKLPKMVYMELLYITISIVFCGVTVYGVYPTKNGCNSGWIGSCFYWIEP